MRIISEDMIKEFETQLRKEEKGEATISKYIYDIKCFATVTNVQNVVKALVLAYNSVNIKNRHILFYNSQSSLVCIKKVA